MISDATPGGTCQAEPPFDIDAFRESERQAMSDYLAWYFEHGAVCDPAHCDRPDCDRCPFGVNT